jgi:hypothetical protein
MEEIPIVFLQLTNNNKIVLICTKIINDETTNYSDYILYYYNNKPQAPCEYSSNVTDSTGTYKATKEYLMSEKNFGEFELYFFNSLSNADGLPILNVQIEKVKIS